MIKALRIGAVFAVAWLAFVVADSAGAQGPPYPRCSAWRGMPCNCSFADYQAYGTHEPYCYCEIGSWCQVLQDVTLYWPPTPTPGVDATPAFVTATPRANQEQFSELPGGCPDWSELGPGTVTPGPDDVSIGYGQRCAACLAERSAGGSYLPTMPYAINTPAAPVGPDTEYWLLSAENELYPRDYLVNAHPMTAGVGLSFKWFGTDDLLGKDIIGAVVEWHIVDGVVCDVEVVAGPERINKESFWVSDGGSYCMGPEAACADAVPGSEYVGGAYIYADEGPDSGAALMFDFGPTRCDGDYEITYDLIVREHVAGGIVVPGGTGTATPTPGATATPAYTPTYVFSGRNRVDVFSGGAYRNGFYSNGQGNCPLGTVCNAEYSNQTLWTNPVGGVFPYGGRGEYCVYWRWSHSAGQLDPGWNNVAWFGGWGTPRGDAGDVFSSGNERRGDSGGVAYRCGDITQPDFVRGLYGVMIGFGCSGLCSVSVSEVWIEYPLHSSQATPTPTPTVTPAGTGTPTPTPSKDITSCAVVEWRTEAEKDGSDVLTWDWSGFMSEPVCYTVVPAIDESIPLDAIPFVGLPEVKLEFPGFELCVRWVEFPSFSLLGLTISLDWFLLPIVGYVIGMIIRM